jgi:nicotinate-nucleotide pyrophosphorylase (carboxylating)
VTRQAGVVAGLRLFAEVYRLIEGGESVRVQLKVADGARVAAGQVLATIEGPARAILSAERVSLNFLGHLSGVATLSAHCAEAVAGTQARVLDTRKTTPGLRYWEKEAVRLGGGTNHRFGLHDGVLIKDNHIQAAGGIRPAIQAARQTAHHLIKIEVECENLAQVREALEAGADAILLDNMSPDQLREAVGVIRQTDPKVAIEASGDIGTNSQRLAEVAATGVDFISLGALTHSAPNFNVSLEFLA